MRKGWMSPLVVSMCRPVAIHSGQLEFGMDGGIVSVLETSAPTPIEDRQSAQPSGQTPCCSSTTCRRDPVPASRRPTRTAMRSLFRARSPGCAVTAARPIVGLRCGSAAFGVCTSCNNGHLYAIFLYASNSSGPVGDELLVVSPPGAEPNTARDNLTPSTEGQAP